MMISVLFEAHLLPAIKAIKRFDPLPFLVTSDLIAGKILL